jgi:hypothetical protein
MSIYYRTGRTLQTQGNHVPEDPTLWHQVAPSFLQNFVNDYFGSSSLPERINEEVFDELHSHNNNPTTKLTREDIFKEKVPTQHQELHKQNESIVNATEERPNTD